MQDLIVHRMLVATVIDRAMACGIDPDLLQSLAASTEDIVSQLEGRKYRPSTFDQIDRFQKLQRQMRDWDRRDRVAAICERMGIKRSRYFELKKLASPPA